MTDTTLLANLSHRATVLSPDRGTVVSFDRDGRLLSYFRHGETFKRSLGSEVHLRFRAGGRQRRRLSEVEAEAVFAEVHVLSRELLQATSGEARRRLEEEILPWSPAALLAEGERFQSAYKPISILPPDQYRSIVVQATEGCSWNRCTFCNFYMDRPFRLRPPPALEAHLEAVKRLLGRGRRLRNGVFLADGNALALSNRRLDPLLDRVESKFPGQPLAGFVDLYSGERRTRDDWEHLRTRGLRRVYIGMETGLDALLEFVNKPGSAAEMEEFVALLKDAGVQVSLIVMVGLGGREYRDRHRNASHELLTRLPLDRQDLIYLSPFVEHPDSAYTESRRQAGLSPMARSEIHAEVAAWLTGLWQAGLRASRYDIREFLY